MFSDVGGASARRRRDTSLSFRFHCKSSSGWLGYLLIFMFFKAFPLLPSSYGDLKCCDREWRWLPASTSLAKALLISLPSKSSNEESLESNWFSSFQSEICLYYSHRSGASDYVSGFLRRNYAKFPAPPSIPESLSSSFVSPPLWPLLTAQTPFYDPSPYAYGALTTIYLTEATLGFCLLGLSPCLGPLIQSQPTSECFSPTLILKRLRFVSFKLPQSPILLMLYFYGSSSQGLCSYYDETSLYWCCEYFLQTLLLSSLLATFHENLSLESFDLLLPIWPRSQVSKSNLCSPGFLESHSSTVYRFISDHEGIHTHCSSNPITLMLLNPVSAGRGHHPNRGATSLCWFGRYHCQEGPSQRISSTAGKFLGPLLVSCPMSLSRTHDIAFFCAEFTPDLEGHWRQSYSVLEVFLGQPSSLVERIISNLLVFSKWFSPETIEAKEPSSTSRILLIVTTVKLPECFAEVSLTHHDLACGMLRCSFCLRVPMDLSPMFNTFSIFLATFVVSLFSFRLMYPTITVDALYSLSFFG